jgi:probable rRNA maturation factor
MIEILNLQKTRRIERARFERLLRTLIRRYGVRKAAVTLSFVGDAAIRRLNRKFRKKDKPTDVLSFPIIKRGPDGFFHLGDIIIAVPRATAQARDLGHSLRFELQFLIIHGFLHLLGFEHFRGHEEEEARLVSALLDGKAR